MSRERSHLERAQQALGMTFRRPALLETALTHPSFSFESENGVLPQQDSMYERLEFLGDSVLGFIITEHLYRRLPSDAEGRLAKLRSALVSGKMLATLATQLDLGPLLYVGRGAELTGARHSQAILADVMESIVGAVYLDAGMAKARRFVLALYGGRLDPATIDSVYQDHKSVLQEQTMAFFGGVPHYAIVAEEGPSHSKTFHAQVSLGGEVWGEGTGPSKKVAEQEAARQAMERVAREHERQASSP
jgi:ribonuclease III